MELDIGGTDLELSAGDNVIEFDTDAADEKPGLEIDLSIGDTGEDESALELDAGAQEEGSIDFDLTSNEDASSGGMDLDATLKIPDIGMEVDEEDDDDHTVFVPRSTDAQEQSVEDEVATKLDLAKAYVELGDKDSARGILEEIIQEGNPQQKATAKELLKQAK